MIEYHRAIFFTKVPLLGYYKYKDVFQIFPCNMENMPKSKYQKHHPNILEFWTSDEERISSTIDFKNYQDLADRTATALNKQDKILTLLSTFTNNLFFRYTEQSGNWGFPILNDDFGDEVNSMSSIWCFKYFYFPDLPRQNKIEKFTDITLPEIKRVDFNYFYTHKPSLDDESDSGIVFPNSIDALFDEYYLLDPNERYFIDTAASYTVSAIELNLSKRTLSLLASFTSLETMVNLEYKDVPSGKCDACNQPIFSVSKKFRDFLLKYVGDTSNNKKKFNSYYSLRSKIIHAGRQLKTELLFAEVPDEERKEELITRIEILQIGKLAIANWLIYHHNEKGVNFKRKK
jgi:hypothetical protein